jgi:hypothetical protein
MWAVAAAAEARLATFREEESRRVRQAMRRSIFQGIFRKRRHPRLRRRDPASLPAGPSARRGAEHDAARRALPKGIGRACVHLHALRRSADGEAPVRQAAQAEQVGQANPVSRAARAAGPRPPPAWTARHPLTAHDGSEGRPDSGARRVPSARDPRDDGSCAAGGGSGDHGRGDRSCPCAALSQGNRSVVPSRRRAGSLAASCAGTRRRECYRHRLRALSRVLPRPHPGALSSP